MGDILNLMLSLTWYGILIRGLFWIGIIVAIVLTVRALMRIAKSQQEISLKLGKLNAILANRQTTGNNAQSYRDTGAGDRQKTEPATAPEQTPTTDNQQ